MPKWEWLAFASAVVAVLAAVWRQAFGFVSWVRGMAIVTRRHGLGSSRPVLGYLRAHARVGRQVDAAYESVFLTVGDTHRPQRVFYEVLSEQPCVFWYRGRPIWFRKVDDKSLDDWTRCFSFIRGTVDWDALLAAAVAWEIGIDSSRRTRFTVFKRHGTRMTPTESEPPRPANSDLGDPACGVRLVGWDHEDIIGGESGSLVAMALRPELEAVVAEVRAFVGMRDWCWRHHVPWQIGYAFHGAPGTGKSAFVRGLGETFDLPIHAFDLASMSNADLAKEWADMLSSTPCIALVEDIDAVFRGRKNVAPSQGAMGGGGLSFEFLINCISGVERCNGVVFIVTTNDMSALDPALVDPALIGGGIDCIPSRPCRIDRVVEFLPIDRAGRVKIALRILDGDQQAAIRLADEGADDTAAQFQERCRRLVFGRVLRAA